MYFPFLTYEVKYDVIAPDIANRQNTYSITLIVRRIVKLFRLANCEKKLCREILAFLILHNYETVRIYSYYPIINRNETTFYRYLIRKFDFTELDSKE
jgi:hypothetical protein